MATKKTTQRVAEKAEEKVAVRLEVNGEVFDFSGQSFKDCLDQVGKKSFKNRGRLEFKKDGKKAEMYLNPGRMRRLIYNDIFRTIMEKNITNLLR